MHTISATFVFEKGWSKHAAERLRCCLADHVSCNVSPLAGGFLLRPDGGDPLAAVFSGGSDRPGYLSLFQGLAEETVSEVFDRLSEWPGILWAVQVGPPFRQLQLTLSSQWRLPEEAPDRAVEVLRWRWLGSRLLLDNGQAAVLLAEALPGSVLSGPDSLDRWLIESPVPGSTILNREQLDAWAEHVSDSLRRHECWPPFLELDAPWS